MSQSVPSHPLAASPPHTVAVVGVGLIGGSVAAALKAVGRSVRVIGVGRNLERLAAARQRGLLDDVTTDASAAAARADLLIVCTPVDRIVADVRELARSCRSGALIMDAGSVKGPICEALSSGLPAGVDFVGAHPMAGSEKQGFEFADANLFRDRVCVLTPVAATPPGALTRARAFWESLGAHILTMPPGEHDLAVAQTSHLPHLVAATLASVLDPRHAVLAASGFRDTTRIAAGSPELWTAIMQDNAPAILANLDRFESVLRQFRAALVARDAGQLQRVLSAAKQVRDSLKPGATL